LPQLRTSERATGIWKDLLRNYQQPPLDPSIAEALEAYVRRRKEEIAGGRVSD
jgi:trimethylamine--corrinoid protein Co-methyltransferase